MSKYEQRRLARNERGACAARPQIETQKEGILGHLEIRALTGNEPGACAVRPHIETKTRRHFRAFAESTCKK
jgi:hypothetical protein